MNLSKEYGTRTQRNSTFHVDLLRVRIPSSFGEYVVLVIC